MAAVMQIESARGFSVQYFSTYKASKGGLWGVMAACCPSMPAWLQEHLLAASFLAGYAMPCTSRLPLHQDLKISTTLVPWIPPSPRRWSPTTR